jgi:hypothetical protein
MNDDDTMHEIHKLSNERLLLWRLAGKGLASPEKRRRIEEITNQLPILWDKHRRELAQQNSRRKPDFKRQIA